MASEEDDEGQRSEAEKGVPKTKKGTLRGAGAVKNPLVAAMEAKYQKKVPLSTPPPAMKPADAPEAGDDAKEAVEAGDDAKEAVEAKAETADAATDADGGEAKKPVVEKAAFQVKRPNEVGSIPPPPIEEAPPPPPSVSGTSPLNKPPPAPPPSRKPRTPPPQISGVPKPGRTKLGMPSAQPEIRRAFGAGWHRHRAPAAERYPHRRHRRWRGLPDARALDRRGGLRGWR